MYEIPFFNLKEKNEYKGSHPAFYDINSFPWLAEIESNWLVIKEEIERFNNAGNKMEEFRSASSPGLSRPDSWKKVYFMNMLWIQSKNCRNFPKTWSILSKIPGITLAGILVLESNAAILPHCSESNVNIRFHLGIDIPAPYPVCGIKVGNQEKGWENGKTIAFSDCHNHTVWNNSDKSRIIVAFDVLRPEYDRYRTFYCSMYLGALTFRFFSEKISVIDKLPYIIKKISHKILATLWFIYLPVQLVYNKSFSIEKQV